ncbi:MAG: tryptophan 7-halogenase [Actinomycetota bacterium]
MNPSTEEFDLIVAGGGPSGSTLATFVAMQGHRVLLLEKEQFPRYQIGESLLPATVHGVCAMLGVTDELNAANFMLKRGGTFRWGKNPDPWTFSFALSPALEGPTSHAYQVERSKFDSILLNNAKAKGVDVRERHTVSEVLSEGGRATAVRFKDADGNERTATARYVAGAAGNTSHLHKKVGGERVYSDFFRNVALFCYFEDGKRLPAPNSGNILSAAFNDGWFWYIPLSDKLTSVGAVISRDKADLIQGGHEAAMNKFIHSCPIIEEYLSNARRVTEGPYGQFRVRKDYSYCNTNFWSPGMVLVGDAACFVDPVFSSGVHLATYSGLLAARSVNSCLRDGIDEQRAFEEFEARYRREYGVFYKFLCAFYDMHQDEDSYFWQARKVLNTDQTELESFISLVAGVSSSGEQLYSSAEEFKRSTELVGQSLQQETSSESAKTIAETGSQFVARSDFMGSLWQETRQVQGQARARSGRRPRKQERALFEGGLVPSPDGLHWNVPDAESQHSATAATV